MTWHVTIKIRICNSYNTGRSALPDTYARCPRARTNMLHFRHSKIYPNFMAMSRSVYIVSGTRCDCRILFSSLS